MNILSFPPSDFKTSAHEIYARGSHPHITYWLKRLSPLNHGEDSKKFKYRSQTVVDAYNGDRHFMRLGKAQLVAHEQGRKTIFFMANSSMKCDLAPVEIDIDCHEEGQTQAEVLRFATHLKNEPMFQNLYCEASTGGVGVHGTVWVEKPNTSSYVVRKACDRLQSYLKAVAKQGNFGVSVEVKGTPPIVDYNDAGGIERLVMGSLCRLPRDLSAAIGSCRIKVGDLLRLEVPVVVEEARPQVVVTKRRVAGSNFFFPQEELDRLPEFQRQAEYLLGKYGEHFRQNGSHRTYCHDLALFLLVQCYIATRPEEDGGNPVARHRAIHRALQNSGLLPELYERAWHHERYQSCRDFLSDLGIVRWEDRNYTPPSWRSGEKQNDGVACSWALDLDVLKLATTQDTNWIPTYSDELVRPMVRLRLGGMVDQEYRRLLWQFDELEMQMAG